MVEAEKFLKIHNIRHLPVSENGRIVGIITDSDVHRASTIINLESGRKTHIQRYKTVADYMSSPIQQMKNSQDVEELVREMIRKKISCFLITDDDENHVGIITTEDLMLLLLDLLDKGWAHKMLRRLLKS